MLKKQCIALYESISKLPTSVEEASETVEKIPVTEIKKSAAGMEEFEIKEANIIGNQSEHIPVQPVNEIFIEEIGTDQGISNTGEPKSEPCLFNETTIEKKSNLINIPPSELSLHAKISGNKHTDIHERINESKVESLKAAIGLNKKIAFVNDLFKENTVDYAKAIDKLNSSVDLNEALHYFNELKHQYSWSNDHELIIELEQLIQKRFK